MFLGLVAGDLILVVVILALDAFLAVVTWVAIAGSRNAVAREKPRVKSNLVSAFLMGIVVLIANVMAIAYLLTLP